MTRLRCSGDAYELASWVEYAWAAELYEGAESSLDLLWGQGWFSGEIVIQW